MKPARFITHIAVSGILLFSPSQAGPSLFGIGVTFSRKPYLNISYQIHLHRNSFIRVGSYIAVSGRPLVFSLAIGQAEQTLTAWQPYLTVGLDLVTLRGQKRTTFTPIICSAIGVSYRPHSVLDTSMEATTFFLIRSKRFEPFGVTLWHFNGSQ